ncbi:MAG: two-component system, chemotaxis family, sensor kinase CheA [Parcubacteria group bacterium Gr01-1014_18]|nr:MAG: two-component system, chemotaxis family, sensor kinase CheA [Parcubacteria group bacterium Greene0416_36]TSC80998.1 MAG: two-component system, chemotaxis family, sensor kinase CheA [Parcubacteria group bacterium Gr01-1014_18]TSC98885.1 MAG: two-component system, chemotaxis family, sensor kinase CheA [Parcubacteria group bacterium Greene1014_20]TSD06529.1 MAG: two-component system, chemotaxis family, sensor kinase CheA [Parcubacteria group bacterium Greene0714_2]
MMDISQFKDVFVSEAREHLLLLESNLLKLEKSEVTPQILDDLMRSSHTIKGSAAAMGYLDTAFLTHVMEDVFDFARSGMLSLDRSIMNTLLAVVDKLRESIDSIEKNGKELEIRAAAEQLKAITGVSTQGIGKSLRDQTGTPKPSAVIRESEHLSHIKVPVGRLDNLLNLVEELVIDKMKLALFEQKFPELGALADHVSSLVGSLQYEVMQVRLVPVGEVFARFPRLVRDLSASQNKKIELLIIGAELELDRSIVDKLAEPLIHLLRNAADHGIERAGKIILRAVRQKDYAVVSVEDSGGGIAWEKVIGKAFSKGLIDGAKRDYFMEKMRQGAIAEIPEMRQLLFGGLSTKETVSETSGRGVGLGIVKKFSEEVGGRVLVESRESGTGTRFSLELPLTLAIINALLVSVDDTILAIPFAIIERSLFIAPEQIKSLADQDVAVVDNEELPLARMEKFLSSTSKSGRAAEPGFITVVVVRVGKEKAGLVVDRLLGEEEIIAKPLPPFLRTVRGFSGSTILGDGRTVLILDAATLLEDSKKLLRVL